MKRTFKKIFYSSCAIIGFLSAMFMPCYSSGEVFSAPDILLNGNNAEIIRTAYDFSDTDTNAWYFPYVDLLVKNNIINGTSPTTYSPDGTFTVAECSAVIVRFLGIEDYAQKCRNTLVSNGILGADLWYSGYVQALFDTGVFLEEDFSLNAGKFIAISNPAIFDRPITRHEFANFITRSFDIDTTLVKAKNIYPEICDNGNSFITGGKYDETYLLYQYEINDFDLVPEKSRDNLLKAYYNGIFNGDAVGNFNPNDNLKRSEMSKVIAVITNPEMRVRNEYRNLPDSFRLNPDNFIIDGYGNTALDRNHANLILCEASKNLSVSGNTITYQPINAPENYFIEVRFYQNSAGVYKEIEKTQLSDTQKITCNAQNSRILFVLRNSKNAMVEGALRVDVDANSNITTSNLFKPVIS